MNSARAWTALRMLYALFFLATGAVILVSTMTGWLGPPAQPTAAAQSFADALSNSGFIDPLVGFSYVAGGGAMMFDRTAPLGIVLLAPSVTVIFFFHLMLSGQLLAGLIVAAVLAALAWRYRRRLSLLWHADRGEGAS